MWVLRLEMADALQLGAGGILALLVIREVLAFLGKRKNGNGSKAGDMDPAFWKHEFRDAVKDSVGEQLDRIERSLDRISEQRNDRDRRN